MPGVDPLLFKAQLIQESALNPNATSPVGAMGLAQIMPGTAQDLSKKLGYKLNPYNAEHSIEGGAYYMGYLRRQWRSKREEADRHSLALASYNAGLGNVLRAQVRCNNVIPYRDIIRCLPDVTGEHAKETLHYVKNIWWIYQKLCIRQRYIRLSDEIENLPYGELTCARLGSGRVPVETEP